MLQPHRRGAKYAIMNIFIIETKQRVATVMKPLLNAPGSPHTTIQASLPEKAEAVSSDVDLLIIDIPIPPGNGLELCRKWRSARPGLPIILLSVADNIDDKIAGFEAGATDYVEKPFHPRELNARIHALIQCNRPTPPAQKATVLQYADLQLDFHRLSAIRGSKEVELTPREFHLLEYLIRNPERPLSRDELAENVWHTPNTRTSFIDVYINYLRKKIDTGFPTKLIHTQTGFGFMLKDKQQPDNLTL